jgi:predicted nucleic acid-binding protein
MRILCIYLETSVFNFVFADDAPDKRRDTLKLFEEIKQGKYEPYTSQYVIEELNDAPEEKRLKMLRLIQDYGVQLIRANEQADTLASVYVSEGVIPAKYSTDAQHIASAVVAGMDFIVSLNFKHIVKRKTIEMTEMINYRQGYKKVGIYSPAEVIDDDE